MAIRDSWGGLVTLVRKSFSDNAVQDLEEDDRDPFALRTLVVAYQKLGKHAESNQAAETLLQLNRPTLEQALIVPAFRLQRQEERRAHFGNAEPRTADTPASR